jgi:hypothetical protein
MKSTSIVFIIILILALPSCKIQRITLTKDLIEQNSLTFNDFKKLQYYAKNSVKLSRKVSNNYDISTETHKLITRSGKKWEIIKIKARTPGICEETDFSDDGAIALMISFEPGYTMYFCSTSFGNFADCAPSSEHQDLTYYGDSLYNISRTLYLTIDKASFNKITYNKRTVPGRRIN